MVGWGGVSVVGRVAGVIWAVCAAATVFFALSLFACWLAGLVGLAEGMSEAEMAGSDCRKATARPVTVDAGCSASLIRLEHNGLIYPVADVWEAIEVTRYLADIESLPETDEPTVAA